MKHEQLVRRSSKWLFVLAMIVATGTELLLVREQITDTVVFAGFALDLHYLLMNCFLVASATVLLVSFHRFQRLELLLVGSAISGWALAHLYWTLYVYLTNSPITYPSVAELGFQSFHLLILPTVVYLHRRSETAVPRVLYVGLAAIPLVLLGVSLTVSVPFYRLAYSLFYVTLGASSLVFALNLAVRDRFRLFAVGVVLFSAADVLYTTLAIVTPVLTVQFLDPVWYVSATLLAVSLIGYEQEGLLG